jgi:hypothetical protein
LQIANAGGNPAIRQGIDFPGVGLAGPFAVGTTWTISCYARVSTTVTSQLTLFACFNNGVNSGVSVQLVNNSVGIPTTTWQRFSTTFTINSAPAGTDNCLMFVPYLANGAYAGNFNITGLQIEQGSVATPYHNATPNQQTELAACQRYYYRIYNPNGGQYNAYALTGVNSATTTAGVQVNFPVKMRVKPSSLEYANSGWYVYRTGGNFQGGTWALNTSAQESAYILYTTSGLVVNDAGIVNQNNAGVDTAYFGFSAEL